MGLDWTHLHGSFIPHHVGGVTSLLPWDWSGTTKMAHSHGWPLMLAASWELGVPPTHGLSKWLGLLTAWQLRSRAGVSK